MNSKERIIKTLSEIEISLAVIKNDLGHIEERTKKIVELEDRIEKVEHLIDKVKGASIILIPIATTFMTVGYMLITRIVGI